MGEAGAPVQGDTVWHDGQQCTVQYVNSKGLLDLRNQGGTVFYGVEWIAQRGNTADAAPADAAPADAVQFVRGDPSTVTVGSTYTLPPHDEPHMVLLIVDEGGCVIVHLAPLGPSGSAATVEKSMKWFASSASPVKLTDEERVRADAARERFTQGEQKSRRQEAEQRIESRRQAALADARQREQEAQRARWRAEAYSKRRMDFCVFRKIFRRWVCVRCDL